MAVSVVQLFGPAQLTASAATVYTAPTSPTTTVLGRGRVRFTNTSNASQAVTAYAIQSGGTAGAANCFLNAESIAANNHLDVDLPVLAAGGFIQAFAGNAGDVTMFSLDGVLFS